MQIEEKNDQKKEYTISLAGVDLKFRQMKFDDGKVVVSQVLQEARLVPTVEYCLVELTYPGTNYLDNDESIELDSETTRYFVAGKSDRTYRLVIDGVQYDLPFNAIGVSQIRKIACIKEDCSLKLSLTDVPDRSLDYGDVVDLTEEGLERIYSEIPKDLITIWLDQVKEFKLPSGTYTFEQISEILSIKSGDRLSFKDKTGTLEPFKPEVPLELWDGMHFFSYPPGGGSS